MYVGYWDWTQLIIRFSSQHLYKLSQPPVYCSRDSKGRVACVRITLLWVRKMAAYQFLAFMIIWDEKTPSLSYYRLSLDLQPDPQIELQQDKEGSYGQATELTRTYILGWRSWEWSQCFGSKDRKFVPVVQDRDSWTLFPLSILNLVFLGSCLTL